MTLASCLAYAGLLAGQADALGVPRQLVLAVAYVESRCEPGARSRAGAQGLMQVMPFWRLVLVRHCGADSYRPATSACQGVRILRHYYVRCRGNWHCALNRYSGGARGYVGRVRRAMQQIGGPLCGNWRNL